MYKGSVGARKNRANMEKVLGEFGGKTILAGRRGGGLLPRELEPNMQTAGVLLVAVEGGAILPTWIGRCQDKVSDVFVLAGSYEEPAEALLHRVEQRLTLLNRNGVERGLAVLVTEGGPVSTAAEIARLRLAQALLGYLSKLGEGALLLLTEEDAPLDSRVQLLSTAGNLAQQLRGTNISVNVRFGSLMDADPPPELLAMPQPPPLRRTTRRPPPQSGQMLKPELSPSLHKSPSVMPRRKLGEVG
jgi:hypothetical protein